MTRFILLLLSMLVTAPNGRAQPAAVEPPKVGQPADFSQIVGVFRMTMDAAPTAVAVEQPLRLTITITGQAQAPYIPTRERLRLFPDEMQRDFFIEPISEQAKTDAWQFVYDLRPKHLRVQFVPGLRLVYFAPRQRRYQTAYTDAIPLTVKARQDIAVNIKGLKVLQAPPTFFELAQQDTTDDGLTRAVLQPDIAFGLALVPPFLCIVSIWWRRRLRRTNSAQARRWQRLANESIAALAAQPCDAIATARILADYLQQRLAFPAVEPTTLEVERWLKRRGISKPVRERWRQILETCDARRYGQDHRVQSTMDNSAAIQLIQVSEVEPCLAA
jgi:hypothetical protein